jgi:hypothetical protein
MMNWGWPQFAMAFMLMVRVIIFCYRHGKPMLEKTGEVRRYDANNAITFSVVWGTVLYIGGFFS